MKEPIRIYDKNNSIHSIHNTNNILYIGRDDNGQAVIHYINGETFDTGGEISKFKDVHF